MVSGRAAAGISPQLGRMGVTEQIDATEASPVDRYRFLIATRVLACISMLPPLTLAADFCSIVTGWVANTLSEPISFRLFMENGFQGMLFKDFIPPSKQWSSASSSALWSALRECEHRGAHRESHPSD